MTYGISKSLLPPAAIDTALLWENLAQQSANDAFDRASRWRHAHSPGRRARSHSPSRRSPKIKHTNGRLDEDPLAVAAAVAQADASSARESREDKQQLLARLQPTPMVPTQGRRKKERGMSESDIPKRGLVRRSATSVSERTREQVSADASSSSSPTRRLKACYRDAALRERSAENTRRMIVLARQGSGPVSPEDDGGGASSTQQKLALKALKYRKLLARAREIDEARLADPAFDVLEGLGVKWRAT